MLILLPDESLVKLCPSCARTFNIARRKHHCRLCGSVMCQVAVIVMMIMMIMMITLMMMCQDCSQFVDFNFCRKLINPSNLSSYKMGEQHRPGVSRGGGQVSAQLHTSNIFHAIRYFFGLKVHFSVSGHPLCGLPCWLQERTVQAEEVRVEGESGQRGDGGGPARLQNQVIFIYFLV